MSIRFHNTLTDRKEEFVPLVPGQVGMYVCGPTVYDMSHIGHARCYVIWDTVARHLRFRGYEVKYVRNFTDVDDKIIKRANERHESPIALAAHYADEFLADMDSLANQRPNVQPRVSDHIPEIITIIEKLIANGAAYESKGDVYFSIRSYPDYGKLSRRNLDDLRSGARVEPGEQKREPLDFALWKAAKPGEISWDSPWGKGRPGWHIECSAMSAKHLGETFDIHAGGLDLVFPHHENEIAQSEAASRRTFARYWMHNGFVQIDGEKMSKSLGNFSTIRSALESIDGQAMRWFLLSTHYRAPINFSQHAVYDAERRVNYIYETLAKVDGKLGPAGVSDLEGEVLEPARLDALVTGFGEAMDDDFNTAEAIGRLSPYLAWMNDLADKAPAGVSKAVARRTLARLRSDFQKVADVLGVGNEVPHEALRRLRTLHARRRNIDCAQVDALVLERNEARKAKDFARADAIRAKAAELGVEIMDTPQGTTWRVLITDAV
jgi:cysteinyl-tRNA synthetase